MFRKKFIAGNWKMNTSSATGLALAKALVNELGSLDGVEVAVCPPFVYLKEISQAVSGSRIAVGAQDMFYENDGAFTGEISAAMLRDSGCRYVILGHSERRHVIGESDQLINRKIIKALADGLDVIFCVGELLRERESNQTDDVVARQVKIGLEGIDKALAQRITIAYEPVWAIGTGKTASPQQAQDVHAMIRSLLATRFDQATAGAMRIQYGGSVKASNAAELLWQADIDGALVGGASLKAEEFVAIAKAGLKK